MPNLTTSKRLSASSDSTSVLFVNNKWAFLNFYLMYNLIWLVVFFTLYVDFENDWWLFLPCILMLKMSQKRHKSVLPRTIVKAAFIKSLFYFIYLFVIIIKNNRGCSSSRSCTICILIDIMIINANINRKKTVASGDIDILLCPVEWGEISTKQSVGKCKQINF